MKIKVGLDERYPDHFITTSEGSPEIEITEEELAFIKEADSNYVKAQTILGRAYKKKGRT